MTNVFSKINKGDYSKIRDRKDKVFIYNNQTLHTFIYNLFSIPLLSLAITFYDKAFRHRLAMQQVCQKQPIFSDIPFSSYAFAKQKERIL